MKRFVKNMLFSSMAALVVMMIGSFMTGAARTASMGPLILRALFFGFVFSAYYELTQKRTEKKGEPEAEILPPEKPE